MDDSDPDMEFELPEGTPEPGPRAQASTVHVGSPEFAHLRKFNMNELCARVTVTGRKPKS